MTQDPTTREMLDRARRERKLGLIQVAPEAILVMLKAIEEGRQLLLDGSLPPVCEVTGMLIDQSAGNDRLFIRMTSPELPEAYYGAPLQIIPPYSSLSIMYPQRGLGNYKKMNLATGEWRKSEEKNP